jgi:hypothetical protein
MEEGKERVEDLGRVLMNFYARRLSGLKEKLVCRLYTRFLLRNSGLFTKYTISNHVYYHQHQGFNNSFLYFDLIKEFPPFTEIQCSHLPVLQSIYFNITLHTFPFSIVSNFLSFSFLQTVHSAIS